jgi:phosphatidylinositol alpha-1,6-mannosyltransferase
MADKTCKIITTHFLPLIGGAQVVYDALARYSGGNVSILSAYRDYVSGRTVKDWQAFDMATPYEITRLEHLRADIQAQQKSGFISPLVSFYKERALKHNIMNEIIKAEQQKPHDVYCIGSLDALGWLSKAIKTTLNKKVILYIHGEEVSQTPYKSSILRKRHTTIASADYLVAVSDYTKACLVENYGVCSDKISVLKNGVHFDRFQNTGLKAPFKNDDDTIKILSVGRLVERKGFDHLLLAVKKVLSTHRHIRLDIVGEGPYKSALSHIIKENGLENSVALLGECSEDELTKHYQSADIFAMPNRTMPDGDTEGFGLVFLEAAAAQTAIIGGNAGGVPCAVIHNQTGLLVDGERVDDIADKLRVLIDDKPLRKALANQAHEYSKALTWQSKAQAFQNLLEKVCTE